MGNGDEKLINQFPIKNVNIMFYKILIKIGKEK